MTFEKSFWNKLFAKLYSEKVAALPKREYRPLLMSLFSPMVIYWKSLAATVTIWASLMRDSVSLDMYSRSEATED